MNKLYFGKALMAIAILLPANLGAQVRMALTELAGCGQVDPKTASIIG